MFTEATQTLIGLVFSLKDRNHIVTLKRELVDFIKHCFVDDLFFVGDELCELRGSAVHALATHSFDAESLPADLRTVARTFKHLDCSKFLYVFCDTEQDQFQVLKLLRLLKRADVEVHFYDIDNNNFLNDQRTKLENFTGISEVLKEKHGGEYGCESGIQDSEENSGI